MKPIDVINETEFVGENKMVKADCFAITFKRITGSNPVSINGYPLGDGESLQFEQTENHGQACIRSRCLASAGNHHDRNSGLFVFSLGLVIRMAHGLEDRTGVGLRHVHEQHRCGH